MALWEFVHQKMIKELKYGWMDICDDDHTDQSGTSRMDVNTAQVEEFIWTTEATYERLLIP